MNRVVITGMGIYSVIGKNLVEVKNSLYEGKSGIIFDPVRKEMGFRSALTGIVERPVLKGFLDPEYACSGRHSRQAELSTPTQKCTPGKSCQRSIIHRSYALTSRAVEVACAAR